LLVEEPYEAEETNDGERDADADGESEGVAVFHDGKQ
jgi:hypothetical protein|tara:strand:- start:10052 stop:10162 length:111 start_codon:yes stop_codon:yes gene_type:complete